MRDTYTDELLGATLIAQDDMIVRWLRMGNSCFEPKTTRWILEKIQGEGIYLDVGASTGWFAIPMALRLKEVVAIECNKRSLQRLHDNASLNGVDIEIHEVAASNKCGPVNFYHNPKLPLTSGGSIVAGISGNRARETVEARTIDSIVAGRKVCFIKMDVEGHEMAALEGAAETIVQSRPFMALEANTESHARQIAEFLDFIGYSFFKADDRNMLCSPAL